MNTQSYIEQATERRWWNPYTWLMAIMAVMVGAVTGLAWGVIGMGAGFMEGARKLWN